MTDDDRTPGRARTDSASVLWGLVLIAVGGWFFVEQTLGIDLPAIPWGQLWPVVLIVLGAWILFQAANRRST